ncbi:MAG: aminotransferase class I/II-fold pyridoxal phosphate-dependent enzyme [Alphaproteobacteria bacterium]|nr:aminotransferase class I/II-fold pyridoxal phosphate-dependent enzyme [Alphaproteobacteria bacterium]
MTIKIARRGMVPPFIVMDVLAAANERAAQGHAVYHLEVGQPSTPAPQGVIEAARRALDAERLGYTESLGTPVLRQRIARHCRDWYGVAVDPARIVVTTGSSGAFLLAFLAAFDTGDRVVLGAPGYPAYRNILTALGVEAVLLPVGANTRFQPTAALLDAFLEADGGRIDGLIIASPSNPTGTMLDRQALADIATLCRARGVRLVSDEIYHGITYGEAATSALELTDQAIVINSFSKYFSMTGWRLGWTVLPDDLVRPVECLTQNFHISPPALSQAAASAAFDCHDELRANVARYAVNRALLLELLPRAGFERIAPADGAFYLYAAVDHLTDDSHDFCRRMLAETGVAATPGTDFDPQRGHRFVRFSFAGATADMQAAAERLIAWRGR